MVFKAVYPRRKPAFQSVLQIIYRIIRNIYHFEASSYFGAGIPVRIPIYDTLYITRNAAESKFQNRIHP
jgi:hypothetical protein